MNCVVGKNWMGECLSRGQDTCLVSAGGEETCTLIVVTQGRIELLLILMACSESALGQEDKLLHHYKSRQNEKLDDLKERNSEITRKYKTLKREYEGLREDPPPLKSPYAHKQTHFLRKSGAQRFHDECGRAP